MTPYLHGSYSALVKLGYDMEDASQVLEAAKKYMLPKASKKALPVRKVPPGAPRVPASAAAFKGQSQLRDEARNVDVRAALNPSGEGYSPVPKTRVPLSRQLTQDFKQPGAILPGASDPRKYMQDPRLKQPLPEFSPDQHKMLHSIVRGHELDEMKLPAVDSFSALGHVSPDVILREHNRVATLPEEFQPVKDFITTGRAKQRENKILKQYGVDFGNSERLNRHQRKHLTRMIDRDYHMNKERVDAVEAAQRRALFGD